MGMVVIVALTSFVLGFLAIGTIAAYEVAFLSPAPSWRSDHELCTTRLNQATQKIKCPSCGDHKIGITPPEALAIADQLRRSLPTTEVQRVYDRAHMNAALAKGLGDSEYSAANITCPLLCNDDSCLAYAARPLHCRSWCLTSGGQGGRCEFRDVEQEEGIVQGLLAAGLQGDVYELNGALATALKSPDTARRWARGEAVFRN